MGTEWQAKCRRCGALGAVLGAKAPDTPTWWWVKNDLCIACFRQLAPDPTQTKKIRKAYARGWKPESVALLT